MNKAIGYIRVSTQKQADEGVSLDAQRAKIEAWCLANNYDLTNVFCDEGISGAKSDREGLLAAMAEAGKGTALVVHSLSRLTRGTKDLISFGEQLEKQGTDLISLSEKIDTTTATGNMFFQLRGVLNEFERKQISERTKAALAYKKANNQIYNHTPYGYTRNGDSLVQNDAEAAVAAQAVKLYHSGQTMRAIARHLNEKGVPTKLGKQWQPMQISRLIKSAA